MSEVKFAAATTENSRPGKKLTKSLFRQIVLANPPVYIDGRWQTSQGCTLLVNYFWKGDGRNRRDDDTTGYLHILWRTSQGELRRSLLNTSWQCLECVQNLMKQTQQLYLGDFCY